MTYISNGGEYETGWNGNYAMKNSNKLKIATNHGKKGILLLKF